MPDIEPFVSPVDGKIITGRRALRDHNKRHNVTNAADFKEEWSRKEKERAAFYSGDSKYDRERRIESLKQAIEKHQRS
jgi:anti-sigma28 factor (negative regulator of flagellin synthesis)